MGIERFKEIFDRYGPDVAEDNVRLLLREKLEPTGVPLNKVRDAARQIWKVYSANAKYLRHAAQPVAPAEPEVGAVGAVGVRPAATAGAKPAAVPSMQLPYDSPETIVAGLLRQGAYDLAKQFIDFIKQKKETSQATEGGE
ncbi:MAG: hypothetical protein DRJ69_02265 [Thermoprotei archaeon]|nr:MAG: hypothetical protein DRJ69_02265 [Thermoprotei archaeon]